MKKRIAAMLLVLVMIVTISPMRHRPGLRDDDIPRIVSIENLA